MKSIYNILLQELEDSNKILDRYFNNLKRINRLIKYSHNVFDGEKKIDTKELDEYEEFKNDILRTVVVFLHASVEEYMREIIKIKLINCSRKDIEDIPLAGKQNKKHTDKFNLGDLHRHMGKTVNDLIKESINAKLDSISFSSIHDISWWLKKVNIDISDLKLFFPKLKEMIDRRHQIVHNVDCKDVKKNKVPIPLEFKMVYDWQSVSMGFIHTLSQEFFRDIDKTDINSILKQHELTDIIKVNKDNA